VAGGAARRGCGAGFGGSTSLSGVETFAAAAAGLTIVPTAASVFAISVAFVAAATFAGFKTVAGFAGAAFFGATLLAGFNTLRAAGFGEAALPAALRAGAFAAFVFTVVLVFAFAKVRALIVCSACPGNACPRTRSEGGSRTFAMK
jgi:hypothetical protein